MSKFYAALEELKIRLQELAGDAPLEASTNGLTDLTFAHKNFVNRGLLPHELKEAASRETNLASPTENVEYGKNVLQAVWNIAHYTSMNTVFALWNKTAITQSFAYMDDDTWVPKIINDRTYQVGKALHKCFSLCLEDSLTEEGSLDGWFTYLVGGKSTGKKLKDYVELLEKRLAVYEAHVPKQIEKTKQALAFNKERLNAVGDSVTPFNEVVMAVESMLTENSQNLTTDTSALKQQLSALEAKLIELEQATAQAQASLLQWNAGNVVEEQANQVISSDFIDAQTGNAHPDTHLVKLWVELYNTKKPKVAPVKPQLELEEAYKLQKDFIIQTNEPTTQAANVQKQVLINKISDAELLQAFELQLKNYVPIENELSAPSCLPGLEANPKAPMANDATSYALLIETLQAYKGLLAEQKMRLQQLEVNFDTSNPLPTLSDEANKPAFVNALILVKQKLQSKVSATELKINSINELIRKATVELHNEQDEEAKLIPENRETVLDSVAERIQKIESEIANNSLPELEKAKSALSQYTNDTFLPTTEKILASFATQIFSLDAEIHTITTELKAKDEEITKSEASRRQFLKTAREKLIEYAKILRRHEGLYMPADSIPKEELIQHLEWKENELEDPIDDLYYEAGKGTSWMGLNRANFFNNIANMTSVPVIHPYKKTWKFVSDLIKAKLELIDIELTVNVTGSAAPAAKPEKVVGKQNLWAVREAYILANSAKQGLEAKKKSLEEQRDELLQQQNAQLAPWKEPNKEHEQAVEITGLKFKINEFERDLAVLARTSYLLEFQLVGINTAQDALKTIMQGLETKEHKDALAYYNANHELINKSNVTHMMDHKGDKDASGTELYTKIKEALVLRKKEYTQLIAAEVPAGLKDKVRDLGDELKRLDDKSVSIDKLLTELKEINQSRTKDIKKKHEFLVAISQLVDLQALLLATYPAIMQDAVAGESSNVAELSNQSRELKINELEAFINKHFSILPTYAKNTDPAVQELYIKVLAMSEKLSTQYTKLRLGRIEEEYVILLNRFPPKTLGQRDALLKAVEDFHARELKFLNEVKSNDEGVKAKLNIIKPNKVQLDHWYGEYKKRRLPEETDEETLSREYTIRVQILSAQYFGKKEETGNGADVSGIFPDYLTERAATYWVADLFRDFAALTFGFFGFKSDSQLRREFIQDQLKPALDVYQRVTGDEKITAYEELVEIIDEGQKQFHPRAPKGKKGFEDSLFHKLELFKQDLDSINDLMPKKTTELAMR